MIAVNPFEMVLRRFRDMWADHGEEFDFVCLFQLSFLSAGYYPGPMTEQLPAGGSGSFSDSTMSPKNVRTGGTKRWQ
jgi:hypothetical protein